MDPICIRVCYTDVTRSALRTCTPGLSVPPSSVASIEARPDFAVRALLIFIGYFSLGLQRIGSRREEDSFRKHGGSTFIAISFHSGIGRNNTAARGSVAFAPAVRNRDCLC